MTFDTLSWYKRTDLENKIEHRLVGYGMELSLPQIMYEKSSIFINRKIQVLHEKSYKEIKIHRQFYKNAPPKEDLKFDLEGNERAVISDLGDRKGYTAFCYIYHKNIEMLNLLRNQENIRFFIGEELEQMNRYGILGDIDRLVILLVDYWVKKFTEIS